MKRDLNVLMLAYYFPPDSSSGSFRPFYFANHLVQKGLSVTVLTAKESHFLSIQPKDPKLLAQLDPRIAVVRTGVKRPREFLLSFRDCLLKRNEKCATNKFEQKREQNTTSTDGFSQQLKDMITDILASPDPHIGWVPGAVKEGVKLIQQKKIDVIYATGSPWSCFLVGALLSRKTNVPLVLDFRDPWTANPSFRSRTVPVRYIERKMERFVLKNAHAIIANTDELRRDFLERYPFLEPSRLYTITNGFEYFIHRPIGSKNREKFVITHAGTLYMSRNPNRFLKALSDLFLEGLLPQEKVEIIFVGGIEIHDKSLDSLMAQTCLKRTVKVLPRLPHKEALEYLIRSDLLLLLQPSFPLQVPRKLYEYIAVRRPILALTEEFSATGRLIRCYNLGVVVPNETLPIKSALMKLFNEWETGQIVSRPKKETEAFLNSKLSAELANVLREVSEG